MHTSLAPSSLTHTHTHAHAHPHTRTPTHTHTDLTLQQKLTECSTLVPSLLDHIPHILVTLGRDGVLWGRRREGERQCHTSQLLVNQPMTTLLVCLVLVIGEFYPLAILCVGVFWGRGRGRKWVHWNHRDGCIFEILLCVYIIWCHL